MVAQDRRVGIGHMSLQSGISFTSIQRILKLDLKLSKRCAKYMPRALTPAQLRTRQQVCDFWSRLFANNRHVFEQVVTVDESQDKGTKQGVAQA